MSDAPAVFSADELRAGLSAEFERELTQDDVLAFAAVSGDHNPLHVDPEYARHSNYQGCIAHGALQVGLASALIGMHLPGRSVLLGGVNARFLSPLYPPCRVRVRGEIGAWNRETRGGSLRVTVLDAARDFPYSEITMPFTLHEQRAERDGPPAGSTNTACEDGSAQSELPARTVLVTGAAGGLGSVIAGDLARSSHVLAGVNRQGLSPDLATRDHVTPVRLNLNAPDWEAELETLLGDRALTAIVHAAWPGAPQGGLLQVEESAVQQQVFHGSTGLIRLARLLARRCGPEGGSLVALGSTYATRKPALNLAAYSLGKAALEHTVRLLAPELARKRITINALCPSFVPTGMNRAVADRQRLMETARVPLGRLCEPEDVVGAVRYLLSADARFLTGETLTLTGGTL